MTFNRDPAEPVQVSERRASSIANFVFGRLRTAVKHRESLWWLTLAPLIAALHFIVCYGAVAVYCSQLSGYFALTRLRWGLVLFTLLCLVIISFRAWVAWRRWGFFDTGEYVHAQDDEQDRHAFLGHITFLIAVLSLVGIVFVASPLLFMETCA